eukprot:CAMPEP_0177775910 /NCGR_PEP_ID=MMETSP0491_2-20121128/14395_1 /TAXON_ID=63592 /ORGANISM="Tetraselmis chuii, Strain PLY429" /LENGTH=37 /DNA_ID= /DNA_START= /DNA_END= /DNA_ORIENTATION=
MSTAHHGLASPRFEWKQEPAVKSCKIEARQMKARYVN